MNISVGISFFMGVLLCVLLIAILGGLLDAWAYSAKLHMITTAVILAALVFNLAWGNRTAA